MKLIRIINKIKKEGGKGDLNIKNKKNLMMISFVTLTLGGTMLTFFSDKETFPNDTLSGSSERTNGSASYWSSSNMREWLNATGDTVHYTNNPPTDALTNHQGYDQESGFLAEFTKEEIKQIAVTQHRVFVQEPDEIAKEGGDGTTGNTDNLGPTYLSNYQWMAFSAEDYGYKADYDKVFLLNPNEMYWYLSRRGYSYEKPLTETAAQKHGISTTPVNWWLSGGTIYNEQDCNYFASGSRLIDYSLGMEALGVVPALHLKPDTVLSNGQQAKDLKIGEVVTFGRYLGAEIEWQVINVTSEGYPLLLSTKILDLKVFDAEGDGAKQFSRSVDWGTKADVSILEDLQYQSTHHHSDIEIPSLQLKDDTALYTRQTEGFTLDFSASDTGGSGLAWIELPNGEKIYDSEFSYTFEENGAYIFGLMDQAGNYHEHSIAVANINPENAVIVTSNTSDWTNQNVAVLIKALAGISDYISYLTLHNGDEYFEGYFPDYIGYAGQQFNISGKVRVKNYTPSAMAEVLTVGMAFTESKNGLYFKTVDGVYKIYLNDLIKNGEVSFDFTYTVPETYYGDLKLFFSASYPKTNGDIYEVEFVNVKYELMTDSDFSIRSITLPNGMVITASEYTDIISTEGENEWTYAILDNRGGVTYKTITTKIDRTPPTATIEKGFIDSFTEGKEYLLKGSDSLSGVNKMEYRLTGATEQDWTTIEGTDQISILLKNSGATTIALRVYDRAGNMTEISKVVTTENSNPCLSNYDGNRFTISDRLAQLELEARDDQSSIVARQYKANDEAWSEWIPYDGSLIYWDVDLMREGLNTFFAKVKDGAGNISDPQEAEIVYDPVGPTITDAEVIPYYTNQASVEVHVVAEDNYEPEGWTYTTCIQLSNDGTNWTTYSTQTGELTVKDWTIPLVEGEQVLYVRGIDNSLNIGPVQEVPYVVDLTAPTGSIIINDDEDFVQEETATLHLRFEDILNGIPDLSGVAQIELFNVNGTIRKTFTDWDWTTHQKDYEWTLEFYEKTNKREYAQVGMIITDRAGNETVIYSKEVELAKLMIKDFHLTNVVNPSVYNKNNPFQLLTYPNFPPQPLLLGASFSYQLDYECLIELKDNWTFEYDLVVLYEKPDGSIVENKETVQAPIRGLSLPLGSFNHDHLLPNEGLPTSTQVYFGTTFRILDENGDLIASDTYPKDSSINGTFVPSNMILIGEIKGHIKDLIRFNEFN